MSADERPPGPASTTESGEQPSDVSEPLLAYGRETGRAGSSTQLPRRLGPVQAWFTRQRDDLIRDVLIGVVLLAIGVTAAVYWDGRIADRQEVQENTRFVRQVVIDNADLKPFAGLNLEGATLAGLDLSCVFEPGATVRCELDCNRLDRGKQLESQPNWCKLVPRVSR
jgi:hypothetical protein